MIGNDWSPNVDRIDRYIAMRASIAAKQIIVFGPVSPCVRLCLRNKWKKNFWPKLMQLDRNMFSVKPMAVEVL